MKTLAILWPLLWPLHWLAPIEVSAQVSQRLATADFRSAWPDRQRAWIGPEYWANRLQDWQVRDGRLECLKSAANKPMRTVHLLTHRIGRRDGAFEMSVRTGLIDKIHSVEGAAGDSATGFLFAAGGATMHHAAAALVHHNPGPGGGWFAGIDGSGRVFLRDFVKPRRFGGAPPKGADLAADRRTPVYRGKLDDVTLQLTARRNGANYRVTLVAKRTGGAEIGRAVADITATELIGNVALVSHPGGAQKTDRYWFRDWSAERAKFERWASATARFWYRDWRVSGSMIEFDPTRALGPVLSAVHTLHHGRLRLTAQLFPVDVTVNNEVELQVRRDNAWSSIARTRIVVPGFTATFAVHDWNAQVDQPYRLVHQGVGGRPWTGTIRKDPVARDQFVVAAFTGNNMVRGGYEYPLPYGIDRPFDPTLEGKPVTAGNVYNYTRHVYFPHVEVVDNVRKQRPDLLFFSGDQVYEGSPTRAVEQPDDQAHLDYLYKWYLWCWTWRDLTRDIPAIVIPDDHDVYQRNIWGAGGADIDPGDRDGSFGGYFMSPQWLNMIQRTQTSNLPPPNDPRPVQRGIEVYFSTVVIGGVGFAVLEDRKFKSFPNIVKVRMSRDSHITAFPYDTRKADVDGAVLLGRRQLAFLREFAADWKGQEMKAVLSQTIFANLQILNPRGDGVPQEIPVPLDRDLDSNGWPQTGRRKALHEMRRGFMVHIAGDQHLASTIHHGTEVWEDACWSLCVPSVANYYARSWNPSYPPENFKEGMRRYTGRYEDGFHNKLTVHAVANPDHQGDATKYPEPVELHREMPGYGIVRFDKARRTITMECWPRFATLGNGKPYAGWPIEVAQQDNYARKAVAYLPTIEVTGMTNPVVQIIDEADGEVVYTLRIRGTIFRPKVFRAGPHTVRVGEPGTDRLQTLRNVRPSKSGRMRVDLTR